MPPKPAPGKKKDDQEDFSDVHTLPPCNSFIFTLFYKDFPQTEIREKLSKYLLEKMPQERVKILNREEIIAYEPNIIQTLPPDDPRIKMTDDEQLAKAACDRLFELSVQTRRAKKDKIQKIEDDAKAQPDSQVQYPDPDLLDVMFQLIDYPQTKSEALAFAKYGNTVNCIFDINFINLPPNEGDETVDESVREQFPFEVQDQELAITEKVISKIDQLKLARVASVKNSQMRNLAFIQLQYFHYTRVIETTNEQGESITQRKEPESIFQQEIQQQLEKYGAMFIKYLRFKERVKILPLIPDKAALQEIYEIEQIEKDFIQWSKQIEQSINQETLTQSQREAMDTSQQEEYNRIKEQKKLEIENEKKNRQDEIEQNKRRLEILKSKIKISLDDEKDNSINNLDKYQNNFVSNKEVQNSVASVMSAMISQLNQQKEDFSMDESGQQQDPTTAAESLDDLFESFENQVRVDLLVDDNVQLEDQGYDKDETFLNPNRLKRQGTEALAKAKTIFGDIEYQEEFDKARRPLLKLQKEHIISDEDKAQEIYLREKNTLNNLVVPGSNRYLMPPVPTKSQRLRNAENPQLYPFCTLPVDDAERALIHKSFQEMIKQHFIDQGVPVEVKHHKYKVFERCYESHMKAEIMKQVIADAFLQEPDLATMYYQRDDSLLLALYNKVIQEVNENIDGARNWQASYRVMPDFENWIKYFADSLLIQTTKQDPNTILPQHLQFDEEIIPDQILDIDDQKISNINENSEMLYPDHNAIMRVDTYELGGQQYKKSIVIKDNLTFGLREAKLEQTHESEKEYGLASYKRVGNTELWIHFENETKLMIETVQIQPNEQRLIRIDPPKPTAEEIAAREEAIKQAQAAAAKNKGKGSQLGNIPQIEEFKEPEPTWEPEPFNQLDSYFDEYRTNSISGPMITTTFTNGLIIRHLFNGDICQTTQDNAMSQEFKELDRVITGTGLVIRHLQNKDAEVLYPNGYKSYFDRQNMMWITTNNKGMRRAQKDGVQWDLETIPCATETDAVTNAKMMIREDNVMTIQYNDGSFYCQHEDGTQMTTNADGSEIRIERDGLAPVVIKQGNSNSYPSQYENSQRYYAHQRTLDGMVKETFMPDGTVIETFLDVLDLSRDITGIRHIIKRPDFSVLISDQSGDTTIISSNARSALNENGGKAAMSKDVDYAKELSKRVQDEDYTKCVFYTKISSEQGQSYIKTVDEKFQYILDQNLQLIKLRLSNENEELQQSMIERSEHSFKEDGRELEDIGGYKNPFTKHYLYPRLFVIKPDGSGFELLSKEQLEYYFRIQKSKEESIKQRKVVMVGSTCAKSHYFLTKVKTLKDKEQELQLIKTLDYPQNARYALQRIIHKKEKSDDVKHNNPDQYLFRQIFEFQEFDTFKQDAFYDDLQRFKQWKLSQVRYDSEFGIVHMASKDQALDMKKIEDDEYFAKRIVIKILKERRNKRTQFQPEEFKKQFILEMEKSEEMTEYHRRVTHYDRDESSKNNVQSYLEVGSAGYDRQTSHAITVDNITQENWRLKKKASAEAKVKQKLADINVMINTPTFIPNYFRSKIGIHFARNNPQKPPSQEVIMRMSQRINRSQQNTEKGQSQYDGFSHKSAHSPENNQNNEMEQQDGGEDKNNPIVALEPEDNVKQGSAYMGSKKNQPGTSSPSGPKPSLYLQEKIYLKQKEQETLLKAEEFHVIKTKDFNVIGRLRQEKPFVKAIVKSNAQTELNEKFITTECIADRRVKISSMAGRQYINAPSIEEVRKQGQHQMILSAINKKQTFAELINQANSMVTSVLHDPLKRSMNILPEKCKFGICQAGIPYELTITLKNEDSLAQRINIKPSQDKRIVIQQQEYGPIAPGMLRKVTILIQSNPGEEVQIKEDIQIVTKADIYKIPVEAHILPEDKFREIDEENKKLGKSIQNSRVRQKLNSSIRDGQQMVNERMDIVDQMPVLGDGEQKRHWIETTGSESKLPRLPSIEKRQFEIDSKKTLKDVLKK